MLKRLLLGRLFQIRRFLQEETVSELRAMRAEVTRLCILCENLQVENENLHAALQRLDLFDQTATSIENGLLNLAVQRGLPDNR
jgi:hypothetical protein